MELATNGMTPTMKYCWSRRRLFSGLSLSYCWSSHTRIIHIISSILDLIIKLEVFGDGLPFDVLTAGPPLDTNVGRPSWSCSLFLFHHDVDVVCVLCAVRIPTVRATKVNRTENVLWRRIRASTYGG